jgi:hypothetical protein
VKKLIGLALELPPLPLGFAKLRDKPLAICHLTNKSDLSNEQ